MNQQPTSQTQANAQANAQVHANANAHADVAPDDKRSGKPRRTERVESRIDLRHKGMRGKMVAGGLLALVGIAAVLLA